MRKRLLVVDDEEDTLRLLDYRFSAEGFEVVTASNGVEALSKARQCLPEVILLDIMMPDLDGFSVCEILHGQSSTAETPVIFFSAHSGVAVQARSIESGARHCLKKSADFNSIIECVRQALSEREEARTTGNANGDQPATVAKNPGEVSRLNPRVR
jgi:DNA-binding response OmpR family regulator